VSDFRVESARTLATAAFLELEQRRVAAPGGETFERVVVRHPGAVAVVPVESDGTAVLVRQYRAPIDRLLLEIPAGKRDVDDESPEVTARRELEEEIARRPGHLSVLATFFNSPGFCDEHTHLFLARDLEDVEPTEQLREEEAAMTIERVPLEQVHELIAHGEIADAKTIIGLLLARARLSTPHVR